MLPLRELPKRNHLESLKKEFPELNMAGMDAYLTLLKTSTDIVRQVDSYLATYDLQFNRFTILVVLYRDPEVPMQAFQLADSIGVRRPTLTGLLDGLEKKALVARHSATADRRGVELRITEAGKKFLRAVLPGYYKLLNGLLDGLSQKDCTDLVRILKKIKT
jgi:DNA-binding MarR family transcriptional regulator